MADQSAPASSSADQSTLLRQLQQLNTDLDASAKLLVRRDLEMSELNHRYEQQLMEFAVLQEATLLGNQTRDRQQMFDAIGNILIKRLNYDRFFVLSVSPDKRSVGAEFGLGFHGPSFEDFVKILNQQSLASPLIKAAEGILLNTGDQGLGDQVSSVINAQSLALVPIRTPHFAGLLGAVMEQQLESFKPHDLEFIKLLASQLAVIMENIDSFLQLRQQNEELRQLDKAKTTFLSIASHQLRTPLSVMKFALSIINNPKTGSLNKDQQDLVNEMQKSNRRIISLVNRLLNITRLEQGRLMIKPEPIKLAELVQAIVQELREYVARKEVQLTVNIPNDLVFEGDKLLIYETFMNLISNGIKYNKQKGKLVITAKIEGDRVIAHVQDTGIGIPDEDRPRLFTQFYRSEGATIIDPEGVGLGLYTTRQFIRLHGGELVVASQLGRGTAFTLAVPVKQK